MTADNNQVTEEMNAFYERADEFIKLANELRTDEVHAGKINASMLYAVARFSAWTAATGFVKGSDYAKEKADIIEHFTKNFERMLSDNIDDYAENFQKYMQIGQEHDHDH
ncbi:MULTISPECIES: DUF3144 domain-containing protein [unclassified Moraxella]|uniref:DUF3144 domain-containing protein n=1 Tax=unclassified Moraxella TaxID=2685852 RepID=UPI003AF40D1E